jgi:Spy/CpxP family protein refolding chaperone
MLIQSKEIPMLKRFVLSLAAVASVSLSVAALTAGDVAFGSVSPAVAQDAPAGQQGGPGAGAAGRARFAKMLMSLNLTDTQKTRIKAMRDAAVAKAKTLTDRQARRDVMRGFFAQIETVLTPAQRTKLSAERAAARAQRADNSSHS